LGSCLPAPDEVDNFDLISFANQGRFIVRTLEHDQIVLDRDATGVNFELRQERADGERTGDLKLIAVERDFQTTGGLLTPGCLSVLSDPGQVKPRI
jgi:hypothetical protein